MEACCFDVDHTHGAGEVVRGVVFAVFGVNSGGGRFVGLGGLVGLESDGGCGCGCGCGGLGGRSKLGHLYGGAQSVYHISHFIISPDPCLTPDRQLPKWKQRKRKPSLMLLGLFEAGTLTGLTGLFVGLAGLVGLTPTAVLDGTWTSSVDCEGEGGSAIFCSRVGMALDVVVAGEGAGGGECLFLLSCS